MSGDGSTIKSELNPTISDGKASDGKRRDGWYYSPKPVVIGSSPTGRKEQAEADLAIRTFDGDLFDIQDKGGHRSGCDGLKDEEPAKTDDEVRIGSR